ncbi:MAG: hypothetical protein HWD58_10605 [Bacteroidota bacterium]|nr:MAG: hypothetical protein HWD58_10605 [Bacteroidota bacterium]
MKKYILALIVLVHSYSQAQNITQLEYFFNTDPGFGNATQASITPAANIANMNINADVTALPQGIHQLYIRSKDANGNWSVTNRSFFYKTGNTTSISSGYHPTGIFL